MLTRYLNLNPTLATPTPDEQRYLHLPRLYVPTSMRQYTTNQRRQFKPMEVTRNQDLEKL
jgi:hypothetical protein